MNTLRGILSVSLLLLAGCSDKAATPAAPPTPSGAPTQSIAPRANFTGTLPQGAPAGLATPGAPGSGSADGVEAGHDCANLTYAGTNATAVVPLCLTSGMMASPSYRTYVVTPSEAVYGEVVREPGQAGVTWTNSHAWSSTGAEGAAVREKRVARGTPSAPFLTWTLPADNNLVIDKDVAPAGSEKGIAVRQTAESALFPADTLCDEWQGQVVGDGSGTFTCTKPAKDSEGQATSYTLANTPQGLPALLRFEGTYRGVSGVWEQRWWDWGVPSTITLPTA